MQTYIALLRGINVSGKNIIKMEDLRKLIESLDFKNVKTYIQTGNVIFQTEETNVDNLSEKISKQLETVLNNKISIFIRTPEQLKKIINDIPFEKISETEKVYISFISESPSIKLQEEFNKYNNDSDSYKITDKQIYILCRNGYGKTLFSNTFIEKKLAIKATTRNTATINKLIDMTE